VKKTLKVLLALVVLVLVLIQFDGLADKLPGVHEVHLVKPPDLPFQAAHTLEAVANPPEDVKTLLRNACYDCHSHTTRWPWYSNVAPTKWFVTEHVNLGRRKVVYSAIGEETEADRAHVFEESAEIVREGGMPLESYVWTHSDAKLSADDRKKLADWFDAEAKKLK